MFSCSCSCVVALHLVWWCSVCTIAEVFSACFPRLGCGDGPQQEACTSIHLWSRAASAYSHDQTWQWVNDLNEADLGRACANKEILPCLIRGRDRRQLKTWRIWMKEGRQRGKVSLKYWGILRMGDRTVGGGKKVPRQVLSWQGSTFRVPILPTSCISAIRSNIFLEIQQHP
jgi:hypothetical protein